jgi:hypothetical protein
MDQASRAGALGGDKVHQQLAEARSFVRRTTEIGRLQEGVRPNALLPQNPKQDLLAGGRRDSGFPYRGPFYYRPGSSISNPNKAGSGQKHQHPEQQDQLRT